MNQKPNFTVIVSCILLCGVVLSSCAESTSLVPSLAPTFSQTRLPTRTDIPATMVAITATSSANNNTFIITPDALFSSPEFEVLSTPDSEDFCEHRPPPQIVANPDRLSLLAGRFVLCPWESWPWVKNTAMDLDTGSFVSKDDAGADIVMQNGHATIDEAPPPFSLHSLNTAQIDGVRTDALNYEYCEQDLLSLANKKIESVLIVRDSDLACIRTTEGKIALLRVEEIFAPNILSAEFSFVILKNE